MDLDPETKEPVLPAPREDLGVFLSLREILLHPKQFFATMPLAAGFARPLIFAALIAMVREVGMCLTRGQPPLRFPINVALDVITIFIISGVLWLFAKLVRGSGSYHATFRAVAYSNVVSSVEYLPVVGPLALLYGLWLLILGIQRAQNLSAIATITVIIVSAVIGGLLFIVLGWSALALFGGDHR